MVENKVHIVITGGTVDSVWDGSKDTVVVADRSVIPEYFERLGRNLKLDDELVFTEVCMKDSREVTDEDREQMIETIEASDARKIILTHGTYTMPVTGRYMEKHLTRRDQTIVITGSFVPIHGFDFSDGPFNFGYAMAQVQRLESGVYVCMNAKVFSPAEVEKDIAEGRFFSKGKVQ